MEPPPYESLFRDDPEILDDDVLYRRISDMWIDWSTLDDLDRPRIRRAAFQDFSKAEANRRGLPRACMSVAVRSVLSEHGQDPIDLLQGWGEAYGLASISVREVRAREQGAMMSPTPEEPWHGVVFSKVGPKRTGAMEKGLAGVAQWVHIPDPPQA
jgi:hypothetical protein